MSKLVETLDGQHAVEIDRASRYYGWVFYKGPDGQWVTKRRANTTELTQAIQAADNQLTDAGRAALKDGAK